MIRLTKRDKNGNACVADRLNKEVMSKLAICKLADYEDAEENRNLINFPVGLGQRVYLLLPPVDSVREGKVRNLKIDNDGFISFSIDYILHNTFCSKIFTIDDIDKHVFLTVEKAEQAWLDNY